MGENKRRLKELFVSIIEAFNGTDGQIKSYQLLSNKEVDLDIIYAVTAKYLYTPRCHGTSSKILSVTNYKGYLRVKHAMEFPERFCYLDPRRKRRRKHRHKHHHHHHRNHSHS